MRHPEHVARLIRPRSTWRSLEERGSRDHDAIDWRDACMALAGCSPLAFQAFQLRHSEEPPGRELVEHLLEVARGELNGNGTAKPEQIVALLLREERAPESHRKERHRYVALGVSRGVWKWNYAQPYARVAAALDVLVSDAWRCARARIGDAA